MPKTDPRVDAYIARSREFARPILGHVRELVHRAVPEAEETLKWGSPAFVSSGKILCLVAAFQSHCTFGFWHKGMKEVLGKDGARAFEAMGNFGKIASLAELPSDRKMIVFLKKAAALSASGVPSRPRPAAPRAPKPVEVPSDLAAALRKNKAAAATFEKLSPSCRREYVQWIIEAKREETRGKRLATALEWLAAGKKRNWKYESC